MYKDITKSDMQSIELKEFKVPPQKRKIKKEKTKTKVITTEMIDLRKPIEPK